MSLPFEARLMCLEAEALDMLGAYSLQPVSSFCGPGVLEQTCSSA